MGRVRKYKKVKNIGDGGRGAKSEKHDQPPSVWESERRKSVKRYHKAFDGEDAFERMLQHEARRQIRVHEESHTNSVSDKGTKKIKTVEGKKEEETMKQFKNRIRDETSKTLRDEISKMTTTAKKGKQYLIDKKLKKRGHSVINADRSEEEEGFSSRHDGHLRPSDLGGSDEFEGASTIKFGERVDQPPEFTKVAPLKLKGDGPQKIVKAPPTKHNRNHDHGDDAKKKKKTVKKQRISDVVERSRGDDGITGDAFFVNQRSGVGGAKASAAELEEMRQKVQAAYRQIRDKNRKF